MAFQSGTTNQDDWRQYSNNTIMVQADFAPGFQGDAPAAVANLMCDSQPQPPTSGVRILNLSHSLFMALVQLADGSDLDVNEAKAYNWRISWMAAN